MSDARRGHLDRWNTWRRVSVSREILSAAVSVGSMTAVVHVATAAKDIIVAYQFGTTDALDAFLIAILLPSIAISIMAGSFASAFIPTYIDLQHREGHEAAERLYKSLMTSTLIVLTGLASILALIAPIVVPFLAAGFTPEKLSLARSLLFILLPVLVLKGLTTVWTAVLNARERFFIAAGIPIFTQAMTVAFLIFGGHQWGIYALVAGTVGGAAVETIVFVWLLRRLRIPITPHWSGWSPAILDVTRQYGIVIAGAFLMSSIMLVNQAMAAMLGPGSVAVLSYGGKVVSFITGVGAMGLGTAVLPHFSKLVTASDWSELRRTLLTYIKWILFISVPLTLAIMVLSEPVARGIFQRGTFTTADTESVGRVQMFLAFQMPFYFISILVVRLISSLKCNSILMGGAVINFLLNVILNYIFMQWFQVAGIALATSIVTIASCCYLIVMLMYILKKTQANRNAQLLANDLSMQPSMRP